MYEKVEELPWVQDLITGIERDAIEWLYWLSGERWRATVSLIALPWMQDSITETERDALEWLFWLADEDWEAYEEVIDRPFLETLGAEDVLTIRRMTGRESASYMGRLRSSYPAIARLIEDLPWTQSPNTETELDAIEWLYWMSGEDQDAAATVAALPWVQDGMTHTERSVIKQLYWLTIQENTRNTANLQAILRFPWIQDNITVAEEEFLDFLEALDDGNEETAAKVIAFPWPQDGITETEADAIRRLFWLAYEDEKLAAKVISLSWVQDSITETELNAIKELDWMSRQEDGGRSTANLAAVLRLPWVQDNITTTEAEFLDRFEDLDNGNESLAAQLIAFPWPQDGITDTEAEAMKQLFWLTRQEDGGRSTANLAAVLQFLWVQDNITATEAEFLDFFEDLDDDNEEAAAAVIAMPFLKSLEPDDVLAMRGMERLDDKGRLSVLLDHPTLRNEITDAQTTLVTAASTLRDDEEIRRMLNPGYADIETLSKGTELMPNLKVSIVRTGSQRQPWTAEGVRDAVQFVEETMQLPLPVSHVLVVLNDKAFTENYGGTNFGFAFGYDPEDEQPRDTLDGYYFQSGNVHETAHYFWRGHADWIDEGVADTFEYMYGVKTGVSPALLEITHREDCEAHDLEMLTEWSPEQQELDRFHCNYYLGQSLFLELLENLGEDEFKARLRELYRLSLAAKDADDTPGIAEVRQAFHDQADAVEKHWSGKLNAPENRPYDPELSQSHDLIQWDQYPTYDGEFVTFSGALLGDAVLSYETLAAARRGGDWYQNFDLYPAGKGGFEGWILPPGHSWRLENLGDATATEYRLEGRTFTVRFPFPKALDNPSDYVVHVWGFQDGSRTPTIAEYGDRLGYARIRVE